MDLSWIERLNQSIGRAIRDYRKKNKISVAGLANTVTLSKSSIVQIERGQQATPIHNLYSIANALNCDIFELLPSMDAFNRLRKTNVDSQSLKRIEDNELIEIFEIISKGKTRARKKKS